MAKHEMHKKSGPASSPGQAVGGKSAPAVGRVGCRVGPAEEWDSYYSSSYSDSDYEPPAVGGAEVESALCVSDSNSDSSYDAYRRQRRQSPAKKRKSGDGSGGVGAASTTRVQPPRQEIRTTQPPEADQDPPQAWMMHQGGLYYMDRFFWKGKWWEAPATKKPSPATAPKQKAQAAKGRKQTTKATVPERYQDDTPAEDQEFARLKSLSRVIMEEWREHEHLIHLWENHRQQYPHLAHLLPPPATHRPPSPEPQQQGEKASSPTPQP